MPPECGLRSPDDALVEGDGPGRCLRIARCPPARPLVYRVDSHRVFIRALAKLQFNRLLSGPMLDIYVGEAKRHWSLHRNLLLHHSERLEKELHDNTGKKLHRLELLEYDPAGFELLVKWLYQGKLDDVSEIPDATRKYEYAVNCHKLYLICDRFSMPQLKNVAMDQYRKGLNEAELVPDADEIHDIYRSNPAESPFRRLATRIAARQIMDPGNDRDVETYRQCFDNNPDFAIDLVKAIRHGAGGILFADPTEAGDGCEYHDHDAGPNCHIKGKGKSKQARPRDPESTKSGPSTNSVPPHRRLRQIPLLQNPSTSSPSQQARPSQQATPSQQHPPSRQAHRQDGLSVGPLRRRLTGPASSTVEMSTETATARPQSPKEENDKFRLVTSPAQQAPQNPTLQEETEESLPAPDASHQSSDGTSRQVQGSSVSDKSFSSEASETTASARKLEEQTPSPRNLWQWAKAGTGKLGIIGRMPHPEWKGPVMSSKDATSAVNGALEEGKKVGDSLDDFSIPSTMATEPNNEERKEEALAAKIESLGIASSSVIVDPSLPPTKVHPSFSQTKKSSDDLVVEQSRTPSPRVKKRANSDDPVAATVSIPSRNGTPATTPSRAQRKKELFTVTAMNTSSPQRIPKYKIVLNSNILSPSKTAAAT
ncbi:hypothetical protein P280DRAFT_402545 [Massarina eburnea CBS 473.64]|uniref:BTB domain-containing protein n=1 Tax=Massarina eburnea CBS 473.64 TaxID=1395130 RepID=A0A6A6RXF2_9PLEO|nr:hypothetical protein P280DRAFT_402545 [Massarina eburnea CBS 473.64]